MTDYAIRNSDDRPSFFNAHAYQWYLRFTLVGGMITSSLFISGFTDWSILLLSFIISMTPMYALLSKRVNKVRSLKTNQTLVFFQLGRRMRGLISDFISEFGWGISFFALIRIISNIDGTDNDLVFHVLGIGALIYLSAKSILCREAVRERQNWINIESKPISHNTNTEFTH